MDDLELTKACALAMGFAWDDDAKKGPGWIESKAGTTHNRFNYDPLTNDAQCFALVKRFDLCITILDPTADRIQGKWLVEHVNDSGFIGSRSRDADLNRAIVECVAKLHAPRLPAKE